MILERFPDGGNVHGNRGQNMAPMVREQACPLSEKTAGRRSTGGGDGNCLFLRLRPGPCAAMETNWPGNPPPVAARGAGGEESAADWDPARSPCDRDARWRGRAAG